MGKVSVIRPEHDPSSRELSRWCNAIAASLRAKGHQVSPELRGSAATRAATNAALGQGDLVLYFGHGDWASLDRDTETLVDDTNVARAAGACIIAVACKAGHTLGPKAVHSGVDAFLGFIEELVWASSRAGAQDHFAQAVATGLEPLADGQSMMDAADAMGRGFASVFDHFRYGAGANDPSNPLAWMSAEIDRHRLAVLGNVACTPLPHAVSGSATAGTSALSVAVIGPPGSGKTTVTAALSRVSAARGGEPAIPPERIERGHEEWLDGVRVTAARVEARTYGGAHIYVDWPSPADWAKSAILAPEQFDVALLVVSATDALTAETREHLELARQVGMPYIGVFLNKADNMVDDEELLELAEVEVRDLLSEYDEFPGDDTPFIIGSAFGALEGDPEYEATIIVLAELLDSIPRREGDLDKPFLMPVEDTFSISAHGTVATGRIEHGIIRTGDQVEIVGIRNDTQTAVVTGVEMFRKILNEGQAGDDVGCLLRAMPPEEIVRGQVLCKPGSITAHTHVKALVYVLTKEEGGRHTPFFDGYRPQFYFWATDVIGVAKLPEGTEMAMPGDTINLEIQLIQPIAMDTGLRFAIHERDRTVARGIVTEIVH